MGKICLQCGDKGSANAFVYCVKCLKFAVHRYCLDVIPRTMDEIVHWVCGDDCEGVAQKQSIKHDHDRIPSHTRDCVVSNNVKGTRNKIVLKHLQKDGPEKLQDACSKADPDKNSKEHVPMQEEVKNNADLPILLPEDEKNIFPLEATKKKGNLSGQKRLLLNGSPENIEKKIKTKFLNVQFRPWRSGEHGLENIVPPEKNSEEGELKVCHDTKSTSKAEDSQKCVSIRSSKKKKKTKKKPTILSKEIIVSCEENYSPRQVQVSSNLELSIYNNDPSGDFPKDLHVSFAEPVAMPIWRGSFDIWDGKGYILNGILAHLSILACQKVFEEASQFKPVLHLEMLPKSDVWPKSFETVEPRGDNIALYFFPSKSSERDFDRLIEEMMHKELALKAVVQNAELLVFDSSELPLLYWKFQGKYYLWGVFRQKQSTPSNSHLCREETNDESPIKHTEKTSARLKVCNVLSPQSPLSISASNGSDT